MLLHPDIAALRSDDTPQRLAQTALFAAVDEWRRSAGVAEVIAALEGYGTGHDLAHCQALASLLSDQAMAAPFAGGFVAATSRALGERPLAHVPMRHFTDGTVSTLLLARSGRAALFLAATNGELLGRQPPPVSVSFAATESHELVLAGEANAELICERDGALGRQPILLSPGVSLTRDCDRQALVLREVRGALVSLRLQRRRDESMPTREVELASGRVIHQAAASADESRKELIIALLGRMGRTDAAPTLATIAQGPGAVGMRWQALRECLGLDSGIGFAALSQVCRTCGDPLSAPAMALREQLLAAHPQLAGVDLCPA